MTLTAMPQAVQPTRRRTPAARREEPGPFPVVVVRPAARPLPRYLHQHRRRQRAANQLAADLTEWSRSDNHPRHGFIDQIGVNLDHPYDYQPWLGDHQAVDDIIRQAQALATTPPPCTVRIGRDRQSRPVVAALHAPQWSMVLRRACLYPVAWVLVGASDLLLRPYGTRELSVEWDEMTRDMYTTLTGGTG
jgi:hypothetical protein